MNNNDKNDFFDYRFQFMCMPIVSTEPIKCLYCLKPFIRNMYQTYQSLCNECIMNYLYQARMENAVISAQSQQPPICFAPLALSAPPVLPVIPAHISLPSPSPSPIPNSTPNLVPVPSVLPVKVNSPPPAPSTYSYPQQILHTSIFICDFFYHFSKIFNIEYFSIETLVRNIEDNGINKLLTRICKALMLRIVKNTYQNEQELVISNKCRIIDLGRKLREIFDISEILEMAWVTVIGEIILDKHYKDYVKDTPVENIKKNISVSLTPEDFLNFSIEEKLGVIEFLINCYLDSKDCREHIAMQIEHQVSIAKIRSEKKQKIKMLEMQMMQTNPFPPELEQERVRLREEEKLLHEEVSHLHYRSVSIGSDSQNNEYYYFKFEPNRIFVFYPSTTSVFETGDWFYYSTRDNIEKLVSHLSLQIKNEFKLKEGIDKLIAAGINFDQDDLIDDRLMETINEELGIDGIKQEIKEIEKKFSKYLKSSKKRWYFESDIKKWRAALDATSDISEICTLLLEFSEKAGSPLRLQTIVKKKKSKYRKVVIKLWQNSQDASASWEEFIKTLRSKEELLLGVEIFQRIIMSYIGKKTEDSFRHSDECFKCDDGGKLIMCENCPRVAHLKCAGLKKVPEGEWLCGECKL